MNISEPEHRNHAILVILDGWGRGPHDLSNPLAEAHLPTINYLEAHYPSGSLQASGIAVGLPWGEVGNSEVGHLTLGAGRVLYQHYPRITMAIRDGSFFQNPALLGAINHVSQYQSKLHVVGILTSGTVHGAFEHIVALAMLAKQHGITRVYFHPFGDGRDGPPEGGLDLMKQLQERLNEIGVGKIATTCGRYYGMDRDGHWDRTQQAYELLTTGKGTYAPTLDDAFRSTYAQHLTDEFVPPYTFLPPEEHGIIEDNDAVIFTDFREDSIRQIATPFALPEFHEFNAHIPTNCYVATFTEYKKTFTAHVAFPTELITTSVSKAVSDAGKTQLKIAETDKYAHVTYFFNGFRDTPFPHEDRILVPSNNLTAKESAPNFKAPEITERCLAALQESQYDLIVINYANADLIAHAGEFDLARQSAEVLDAQLQQLVAAVEKRPDTYLIITADHGNVENVRDAYTGEPKTKHDPNPVPIYIVNMAFAGTPAQLGTGILSDVAPTLLSILAIPIPKEMTGKNLLTAILP
ncbi:MAG: 2,3-bisphosphoglycerate-independent phosphoglycerate mutase [Patescibacteria group bacterium]|nr:2,3-bisphosphoglycerate-independent phosphoglycerate mutase [Patescibacteria group bacterium]MDE2438200.1 2,3-bisphosphoglycerate-independent phosphoglycerate mutase [Patescibacteria group bacterium]